MSALMATLFSLSKSRKSHEPITLAASGVNVQKWVTPLFALGFLLTLITFSSLEWFQPWGETYKRNYLNHVSTRLIKNQLSQRHAEFTFEKQQVYIYHNDDGLTAAIIQQKEHDLITREIFLTSTNITVDDEKSQLVLSPQGPIHLFNFTSGEFGHGMINDMNPQVIPYPKKFNASNSNKNLPLSALYQKIYHDNSSDLGLRKTFYEKLCLAFSPLLLIFVAIPIAFMKKNNDPARSFAMGLILIFIIYYPAMIFINKSSSENTPFLGLFMQTPNFILIALAFLGLRRINLQI